MILRNGLPSSGDDIALDDGLQFGRGAFETLRVTGRPLFLERHCERLNQAMARLGLPRQADSAGIAALVERYRIRDCVLKILLTRKNELLITRPFPYLPEAYARGFRLTPAHSRRATFGPYAGFKTLNYLESLLARETAVAAGYDDALFLNERGDLAETASANLFFVKDGAIHTPDPECGLLEGILRQWVMENAPVQAGRHSLDEIRSADEVFLTNSVVGIMPVSEIDGTVMPMPENGVTRTLMESYKKVMEKEGGS